MSSDHGCWWSAPRTAQDPGPARAELGVGFWALLWLQRPLHPLLAPQAGSCDIGACHENTGLHGDEGEKGFPGCWAIWMRGQGRGDLCTCLLTVGIKKSQKSTTNGWSQGDPPL